MGLKHERFATEGIPSGARPLPSRFFWQPTAEPGLSLVTYLDGTAADQLRNSRTLSGRDCRADQVSSSGTAEYLLSSFGTPPKQPKASPSCKPFFTSAFRQAVSPRSRTTGPRPSRTTKCPPVRDGAPKTPSCEGFDRERGGGEGVFCSFISMHLSRAGAHTASSSSWSQATPAGRLPSSYQSTRAAVPAAAPSARHSC